MSSHLSTVDLFFLVGPVVLPTLLGVGFAVASFVSNLRAERYLRRMRRAELAHYSR